MPHVLEYITYLVMAHNTQVRKLAVARPGSISRLSDTRLLSKLSANKSFVSNKTELNLTEVVESMTDERWFNDKGNTWTCPLYIPMFSNKTVHKMWLNSAGKHIAAECFNLPYSMMGYKTTYSTMEDYIKDSIDDFVEQTV